MTAFLTSGGAQDVSTGNTGFAIRVRGRRGFGAQGERCTDRCMVKNMQAAIVGIYRGH
jgi:hypothetical protein